MDKLDYPTTSSRCAVVKAIRARELRGVGNNIGEMFDDRCSSLSDTSRLIKTLRNREIRGKARRNDIYGNIFERNREKSIYQKDLKAHTGCVNAVEFSPQEEYIVSGGDDCNVLVWRTAKCCVDANPQPVTSMEAKHESNIFALRFSLFTERIYSAGNDFRLLVHDLKTRALLRTFTTHGGCYYRISTHPANDDVIAAASEDKHAYIYDLRLSEPAMKIKHRGHVFSVEYNRRQPNLIAVCSKSDGLVVHDIRKATDYYASAGSFTSNAICAQWSPEGDAIFCIISKSDPIYFNLLNSEYIHLRDPEYKNLCTVKSCTFAGSNYLVTGSDDWNIYVWKVPDVWTGGETIDQAYTVLKGHRSVVNHIQYGEQSNLLISCGVEKIVKCWSAAEMQGSYRDPRRRTRMGRMIITQSPDADLIESTEEDLQVLYMFDHFYEDAVQRELINLDSNSDDSSERAFLFADSNENSSDDESFASDITVTSCASEDENDSTSDSDEGDRKRLRMEEPSNEVAESSDEI
ncbi:DDB1- and CUL4-associated factor 5 [Ditylenchus destructor]|nr:DDB1- and CUL4-associated factor 5 [Ditylenchus destructor]